MKIPERGRYGHREIKALRQALGVSLGVFTEQVGVSLVLVAQWEAGMRRPVRPVRRLLDKIKEDHAGYGCRRPMEDRWDNPTRPLMASK